MTAAQAIEQRITRQLIARGQSTGKRANSSASLSSYLAAREQPREVNWTARLIAILATTVSLFVLGSFLEELLWAVMAAGTIFVLGVDE